MDVAEQSGAWARKNPRDSRKKVKVVTSRSVWKTRSMGKMKKARTDPRQILARCLCCRMKGSSLYPSGSGSGTTGNLLLRGHRMQPGLSYVPLCRWRCGLSAPRQGGLRRFIRSFSVTRKLIFSPVMLRRKFVDVTRASAFVSIPHKS